MWARYDYKAGATRVQILDDIVAILTGQTDVSLLSAGCEKTTTTINATVASGWTLVDSTAPGTTADPGRVIKSPQADGTKEKFVQIRFMDNFRVVTYIGTGWNADTNAFIGDASDSTWYQDCFSETYAGTIFLFAQPRYFYVVPWYNAAWKVAWGVSERTRFSPWDTVANDYPLVTGMTGIPTAVAKGLTFPHPSTLGSNTANTILYLSAAHGGRPHDSSSSSWAQPLKATLNAAKTAYEMVTTEVYCGHFPNGHMGGKILGCKMASNNIGVTSDDVTIDGVTHFLFREPGSPASYPAYAFPKV